MIITALKQQLKDTNRVSIFLDKKYACSLTLDQILEQKLKVGTEIDDGRLKALERLSNEGKVYYNALDWCLRRPHSASEFKNYMYRKKVEPDLAEKCLQKLTRQGYIDDKRFARWLVEMRIAKNKSLRFITGELRLKGVSTEIIQSVLRQTGKYGNNNESDSSVPQNDRIALNALVLKLQGRQRYADQNRLMRYLLGKGFSYSDIQAVLHNTDKDSSVPA